MTQTNTLPAQTEKKPLTLRDQIDQMIPEFRKALPGHIPVERFARTVQTAIQMNPEISQAAMGSGGGLHSLFAACTKAATDGLILDGREAALVTFNQKVSKSGEKDRWEKRVQYIPMVAGLLKKARNSGEISTFAAHVVYEKDKFTYILGDDERIEHAPAFGERGDPIAVYAIVRLKDGSVQREVMDMNAVMGIAKQSKNPQQYDPKSGKNFGEWWRKTVIRRISKYLPSSSDRDEFMQAVERIDDGFDFDRGDDGQDSVAAPNATTGKKARGGAAAALKDVTPKASEATKEPTNQQGQPADQGESYNPETGEIIDADSEEFQPGDDI